MEAFFQLGMVDTPQFTFISVAGRAVRIAYPLLAALTLMRVAAASPSARRTSSPAAAAMFVLSATTAVVQILWILYLNIRFPVTTYLIATQLSFIVQLIAFLLLARAAARVAHAAASQRIMHAAWILGVITVLSGMAAIPETLQTLVHPLRRSGFDGGWLRVTTVAGNTLRFAALAGVATTIAIAARRIVRSRSVTV